MAAFQQLVKLLPAVAGEELLKIDGGGAVGDVGNAGACVSKHSTDRTAHIPKVTTFVPPRRGPRRRWVIAFDPIPDGGVPKKVYMYE